MPQVLFDKGVCWTLILVWREEIVKKVVKSWPYTTFFSSEIGQHLSDGHAQGPLLQGGLLNLDLSLKEESVNKVLKPWFVWPQTT